MFSAIMVLYKGHKRSNRCKTFITPLGLFFMGTMALCHCKSHYSKYTTLHIQ